MVDPGPDLAPEASIHGDEPSFEDGIPTPDGPRIWLPAVHWRRTTITIAKVAGLMLVVSVALGLAAFAATTVYAQYGAIRNEPNAAAWGGLTPRFAGQAACTSCHVPEAGHQDASIHVDVSCETCHGAAAAHAADMAAARSLILPKPTSEICVTCHAATAGRPDGFPQVDPATHYAGGECLRCHDPHSVVAVRPPVVTHPLDGLPVCTTCHAPDGLKKVPAGHEPVPDKVCLGCHARAANGTS